MAAELIVPVSLAVGISTATCHLRLPAMCEIVRSGSVVSV